MGSNRPYKRRKYFVKQWLQLRYMLILAGSTVAGGVIFGFVMKHTLQGKIRMEMYRPHSRIQTLWEILYPDVMRMTLILFVCSVAVMFILLQLFSHRINRASGELEDHIDGMIRSPEADIKPVHVSVKEFGEFGREVDDLLAFYRNRWDELAESARTGLVLCENIEAGDEEDESTISCVELLRHLESMVQVLRREGEERNR